MIKPYNYRTLEGNSKEETRDEEMSKLKASMVKSGYTTRCN